MDGSSAIETNRKALLRIVAGLVSMTGWTGSVPTSPLAGEDGEARRGEAEALAEPGEGVLSGEGVLPGEGVLSTPTTISRRLRNAILLILRPAEAATRRLAIAMSRSLPALPPIRLRKLPPKPKPEYFEIPPGNVVRPGQRKTGIILPPNALKRFGPDGSLIAYLIPKPMPFVPTPPPRKRKPAIRPRRPAFALLDPLANPMRVRKKYAPRHNQPRVWSLDTPRPVTIAPPSPRDQLDAAPLARRFALLADALNDLPKQARRYQLWRALRIARKLRETSTGQAGRRGRLSPLRPGRAPGCRIVGWNPDRVYRSKRIREIDEILAHAHDLALYALEQPDTS
jgi:hypothetical protein